jgi:hypothetical protein
VSKRVGELTHADIDRARRDFIAMHGREPNAIVSDVAGDPTDALAELGPVVAFEYLAFGEDGQPEIRRHDFRPGMRICSDSEGAIIITGDTAIITERGIEGLCSP